MSVVAPPTPATLTGRLLGDLAVCVDDPGFKLTVVEKRWGLTGPIVSLRDGMPVNCMCGAWSDIGCCHHALDARAIVLDTLRALEVAAAWPAGERLPVEIRRAYVVACVLVQPRAHVWPQLHPVHLRRRQVDSEMDA